MPDTFKRDGQRNLHRALGKDRRTLLNMVTDLLRRELITLVGIPNVPELSPLRSRKSFFELTPGGRLELEGSINQGLATDRRNGRRDWEVQTRLTALDFAILRWAAKQHGFYFDQVIEECNCSRQGVYYSFDKLVRQERIKVIEAPQHKGWRWCDITNTGKAALKIKWPLENY